MNDVHSEPDVGENVDQGWKAGDAFRCAHVSVTSVEA
jgi:hypothetical protein